MEQPEAGMLAAVKPPNTRPSFAPTTQLGIAVLGGATVTPSMVKTDGRRNWKSKVAVVTGAASGIGLAARGRRAMLARLMRGDGRSRRGRAECALQ